MADSTVGALTEQSTFASGDYIYGIRSGVGYKFPIAGSMGPELLGYVSISDIGATTLTTNNTHHGRILRFTSGSSITVTLPAAAVIGTTFDVIQSGAGQITFAAGSGGSLVNRQSHTKTAGQHGRVRLTVTSNSGGAAAVWNLSGDTAA